MAGMQGHNASPHGFQPVRLGADGRASAPLPSTALTGDDATVAVPRGALLQILHDLNHLTSDEFAKGGDRRVRELVAALAGVDVDRPSEPMLPPEWDRPLHIDLDRCDDDELAGLAQIGAESVWDVAAAAVDYMHEHGLFGDGPTIERQYHRDDQETFSVEDRGPDGTWVRRYIGESRDLFNSADHESIAGIADDTERGARAVEMVFEAARFSMRKAASQADWLRRTHPAATV